MRNSKYFIAFFLASIILIGNLAGCGSNTRESKTIALNLTVCLASEPDTIDPALNSALDNGTMLQHFFEGLLKWVDDGNGNATLTYGQAESMDKTVNEDGTVTYTFIIRDNARWSDGQTVTANDFVYAWQRLVDYATASPYSYQLDMVKGYDSIANGTGEYSTDKKGNDVVEYAAASTLAVSAPDIKTFVVTLSYDCPYFEEICAFPSTFPVRKDIIESAGDQWTFDPDTYISNGPYKMSKWVHNSYIKAVKNKNYYDAAKLGPNSITFQLMDDAKAMYSAFESGTLHFIGTVPTDEIPTLLSSNELKVVNYLGTSFVCFQNQKAPFNDERVRKAFSLAVDRNYIVDNVTHSGEVPANAYVPSGIYDVAGPSGDDFRTTGGGYYSVAAEDYEANCEKARQLLADAGYPNGEGFPTVEYLYSTDDRNKAIAEALQQMWKTQLGVDITIRNKEWAVNGLTLNNGDFSISQIGFTADYNDPCTFIDLWRTGGSNNIARFSNVEYDVFFDVAKITSETAERMKNFHAAEDILMETNAIAPLYFYTNVYMLDNTVQGMYYTPLGYFFFGYCTKATK